MPQKDTMKRTISTQKLSISYERTVVRESDDDERDPTPSYPALRVVTVDGHTVSESTKPLAKCRQVTPFAAKLKRMG